MPLPATCFYPRFSHAPKSLPILIQFVSLHLCYGSEKFQKAELTPPATSPEGPSISCWPHKDSGRGERVDKEQEGMMEVDGKEFCGLGLEVRAVRPVGTGGVHTMGNEVIC